LEDRDELTKWGSSRGRGWRVREEQRAEEGRKSGGLCSPGLSREMN
jgi:hypothetical protein